MKQLIVILVITLFLLVGIVSATNTYKVQYTISNTSNPVNMILPSFYSNLTSCSVTIQTKATMNKTGEYTATASYYSPNNTLIASGTKGLSDYVSCTPFGISSTSTHRNNIFEAMATLSHTATTVLAVTGVTYQCQTDGDWITIETNSTYFDSRGFLPNVVFGRRCFAGVSQPYHLSEYFAENTTGYCNTHLIGGVVSNSTDYADCGWGYECEKAHYWLFNSSFGTVKYSAVSSLAPTSARWYYYKYDSPFPPNYLGVNNISGILSLDENELYVFMNYHTRYAKECFATDRSPQLNLSIYVYQPDWNCLDWSPCENGSQFRTCIDPLGKAPDKHQYRSCYVVPYISKYLGFEDSIADSTILKCQPHWWGLWCAYNLVNKTLNLPAGWMVGSNTGFIYDFLDMTSETAKEGTQSLKMWYIPPMPWIPVNVSGTWMCNYSSQGIYPFITKLVNDSLFVAYNITFPTNYMTINFYVKKCQSNPIQYQTGVLCGDSCYGNGGNCSDPTPPRGDYFVVLYDWNTSSSIWGAIGEAYLDWKKIMIDISNMPIIINRTYALVLVVRPRTEYSYYGNCVYFDDVSIDVSTQPLTCEASYCIGNDYYKPNIINNSCTFVVEELSDICVPADVVDEVINCSDFCINLTYYDVEIIEGGCQLLGTFPNSAICVEEQRVREEEEEMFEPPEFVKETFNETWLQQIGFDWTLTFFSPFFILLFIAIGIAGGVAVKMKESQHAGTFGSIIFMVILGTYAVAGLYPIWFVLIEIVLAGFFVAKFMVSRGG